MARSTPSLWKGANDQTCENDRFEFSSRRTAVSRPLSPLADTDCGAAGGLRVLLGLHQRGLKTTEGASCGSACSFRGSGQGSATGYARLSGRTGVGDCVLHGEHKK